MSIRVVSTLYPCTLQDAGRTGYRAFGIPVSGPMDSFSFRLANILCGNDPEQTALEITLHGLVLCFEEDVLISLCGGGSTPSAGDLPLPLDRPVLIRCGTVLQFRPSLQGCRMYLAIAGGFVANKIMDSTATYAPAGIGGFNGRAIRKGDLLKPDDRLSIHSQAIHDGLSYIAGSAAVARWGFTPFSSRFCQERIIRFVDGPEWERFDEESKHFLENSTYFISDRSDRMGYQLKGHPLRFASFQEMLSSGVCPGTVQVTHAGFPILLMADGQTTGGYPRVAQVISADLSVCGQLRPGSEFQFRRVTQKTSEDAFFEQEGLLTKAKQAITIRYHL
jgi:antagonist of KipI